MTENTDVKKKQLEEKNQTLDQQYNTEKRLRYITGIGFAAAKIEENAFDKAREVLTACPFKHHWEWRRLQYLCDQAERTLPAEQRLEAVAFSPDGRQVATGGWGGQVHLWIVQDDDIGLLPRAGVLAGGLSRHSYP